MVKVTAIWKTNLFSYCIYPGCCSILFSIMVGNKGLAFHNHWTPDIWFTCMISCFWLPEQLHKTTVPDFVPEFYSRNHTKLSWRYLGDHPFLNTLFLQMSVQDITQNIIAIFHDNNIDNFRRKNVINQLQSMCGPV